MKPADWPRYMIVKKLRSGVCAYYWNARNTDIKKGFKLTREPLGCDYGAALVRAAQLNSFLDAWRAALGSEQTLDIGPRYGSVDWWIETYCRSPAFQKLKDRTKPSYLYQMRLLTEMPTKTGGRLGELPVKSITPAAVDKIYEKLRGGVDGKKLRRANHTIDIVKKAWSVVQRTHPQQFGSANPFVGLTRFRATTVVQHATRTEAIALSDAIKAMGHPHLAVVPLICFEWLQRPENILAGHLSWHDYRPDEKPAHVRIFHHKTGEVIWHPLEGGGELFYAELETRLSTLAKIAVPIVATPGERGSNRPYSFSYAKRIVREARRSIGLGEHVTLTACRHGGMTELGDAELTEQGVMSLSGHRTPDAARGYVKRTDTQRLAAARKRHAWVSAERALNKSQNEPKEAESE